MSKTVFLMWDCYGLETAFCITDIEQQRMWAMLRGKDPNRIPMPLSLQALQIRAQANTQRGYELYLLQTDDDIRVDDIVEAFESAPQQMAERVREIGHRIGDFRQHDQEVRIR